MTAQDVEIAVAKHFNYRTNVIVPNVYWGLGLRYEADLVVLRPSNWAIEVEIKVSASDIKADLRKAHQHDSRLFKELYFAVPEELKNNPFIPDHAGILSASKISMGRCRVEIVRAAQRRKDAIKWEDSLRCKLAELGAMRIWTFKQHLSEKTGGKR